MSKWSKNSVSSSISGKQSINHCNNESRRQWVLPELVGESWTEMQLGSLATPPPPLVATLQYRYRERLFGQGLKINLRNGANCNLPLWDGVWQGHTGTLVMFLPKLQSWNLSDKCRLRGFYKIISCTLHDSRAWQSRKDPGRFPTGRQV